MIGERMKELRLQLGYSAEQVAAFLNVAPATIYRYENGDISKMPSKFLKPLAEYLCTTPGYLMGWTEEQSQTFSEHLTSDELFVIETYRDLSDHGKKYIHEQLTIATHMFGEKADDASKTS